MEFNNSDLMMMVISLRQSIKIEESRLFKIRMENPNIEDDNDDNYVESIEESMCSQYIKKLNELLTKVNTEMNII